MNKNSPAHIVIAKSQNGWVLKTSMERRPVIDTWTFIHAEDLGHAVVNLVTRGEVELEKATNQVPEEIANVGAGGLATACILAEPGTKFPAGMGSIFAPLSPALKFEETLPFPVDVDLEVKSLLGGVPEHVDWLQHPFTQPHCVGHAPFFWMRGGQGQETLVKVCTDGIVRVLLTNVPRFVHVVFRTWSLAVDNIQPQSVQQIRPEKTLREKILTPDGWTRIRPGETPSPGFFLTRNIGGDVQKVRLCTSGRVRWVKVYGGGLREYLVAIPYTDWDTFCRASAITEFQRVQPVRGFTDENV